MKARPPQEVQQHCLRLVIGGVTQGHCGGTRFRGHLRQEPVAKLAGRLLERGDTSARGGPLVFPRVPFGYRYRQPQLLGQGGDKPGVGLRLLAAEIVIQMGHVES